MIGGPSPLVSSLFMPYRQTILIKCAALKVHHDGFSEAQPEYLSGDIGVPGISNDVKMSDMYRANGLNGEATSHENTA